jgi:DNA-binding NarL/FixJ family response regulator
MDEGRLTIQLQSVLGMEGYVRFCQALGGTRVYVSHRFSDNHATVEAVGRLLADKLSRALAPATIRVPLARRERALFFRQQGLSDAKIALQLGITENGVGKLFKREADLPDRPGSAKSNPQLSLF